MMSPMPKGREQAETTQDPREATEPRSQQRLRAAAAPREPFVLAFADALRDILHDEPRPTG